MGPAMRKKKRQKHPYWFPPTEAILERTLIQKLISVFLKIVLQKSHQLLAMAKVAPFNISIASLNFASFSSPSSLANSCTFLISVWRLIKGLTQSMPTTVPGRRRRVFFLTRLKGRKIFGLCFLCLSCDVQNPGGILGSWKGENSEFLQNSGVCRCKRMVLPWCLI